jgi:hypothetical protein
MVPRALPGMMPQHKAVSYRVHRADAPAGGSLHLRHLRPIRRNKSRDQFKVHVIQHRTCQSRSVLRLHPRWPKDLRQAARRTSACLLFPAQPSEHKTVKCLTSPIQLAAVVYQNVSCWLIL